MADATQQDATEQGIEAYVDEIVPAVAELAQTLVVSADGYARVLDQLSGSSPAGWADTRRRAYAIGTIAAQMYGATMTLVPALRDLSPKWRPPRDVLHALGAIVSGCMLISTADSPERLHDAPLPQASVIRELLTAQAADAWLRRMLPNAPDPGRFGA